MTIELIALFSIFVGVIVVAMLAARSETRAALASLSARVDRAEERNQLAATKDEFELIRSDFNEIGQRLAGLEASFRSTNSMLQNIHNIMMSQHK